MLKRNLAIFTLAICGFMNLQAMEVVPSSNPIKVNQEETQQEQLACKNKKHKKHNHKESSSSSQSSSSKIVHDKIKESKLACGKRKKHKTRHVLTSEETLAGCKRCTDKLVAA